MIASIHKKHGSKSYYVLNDDKDSLKVLAKLRGYAFIKKNIIMDDGNKREITVSPIEQLLNDN